MVALAGKIDHFNGLLPVRANKRRKIYTHRTSVTAPGTTQAGPDIVRLENIVLYINKSALYHLSWRKLRAFLAYGATACTYPALHAIIDLLFCELHSLCLLIVYRGVFSL
jgi:hypothetical protein